MNQRLALATGGEMTGEALTEDPPTIYVSTKFGWNSSFKKALLPPPEKQYEKSCSSQTTKRFRVFTPRTHPVGSKFAAEFEHTLRRHIDTLKLRDCTKHEAFDIAKVSGPLSFL